MSAAPAAPARAASRRGKLIWIVACVFCIVAGAALPYVVDVPALMGKPRADGKPKPPGEIKTATIPVGDVTVNLAEERMTRYLRIKIAVVVDEEDEEAVTERLTKHKTEVKSRLIGHLAGKTLKDVGGSVGVHRLQRELLERIEDVLYPEGGSRLRNVLFEEYVVQ